MAMARKDDLTPLKRELLESLESRRTNQEIAEALRIDERTVETHVANALHGRGRSDGPSRSAHQRFEPSPVLDPDLAPADIDHAVGGKLPQGPLRDVWYRPQARRELRHRVPARTLHHVISRLLDQQAGQPLHYRPDRTGDGRRRGGVR